MHVVGIDTGCDSTLLVLVLVIYQSRGAVASFYAIFPSFRTFPRDVTGTALNMISAVDIA